MLKSKFKKRPIALILILSIVFSIFSAVDFIAFAEEEPSFNYKINDDGKTITITGSDDYLSGKLTIPSSIDGYEVTEIGEFAFCYNCGLETIEFPHSVLKIGKGAFGECDSISSVIYTGTISEWCKIKFEGGFGLSNYLYINGCLVEDLIIPDGITSISGEAFASCESLKSVEIPDSVISIGRNAFDMCNNLTKVNYVGSIEKWCKIEFANYGANPSYCSKNLYIGGELLQNLKIPDGMTSIGDWAFFDCKDLNSITIPDSMINVGTGAFSGCSGLTDVVLPDSITTISDEMFSRCSGLKNITIHDSVTHIGEDAFYGCKSLTDISIPNSVKQIGEEAFSGCSGLTNITIPDGITSLNSSFRDCENLKYSIYNGCKYLGNDSNKYLAVFDTVDDNTTSVEINPNTKFICTMTFYNCEHLKSIKIPDSVMSIGGGAFSECRKLESVNIPDGITEIDVNTFFGCGIKKIKIPRSVKKFGGSAFDECGVTNVDYDGTVAEWCDIEFCGDLSNPVRNGDLYINGELVQNLIIPQSVKVVKNYAFTDCKSIRSVEFLNGVEKIGAYTFEFCSGLTTVKIPNSVTNIGAYAFWCCRNLKSVIIPESVEEIGASAFAYCDNESFTVYGYKNSYAEKYCIENKLNFAPIIKHEHKFNKSIVTKKATMSADGVKTNYCDCGEAKKEIVYKANKITLSKTSFTYNGKTQTPKVTVKDSKGKTLKYKTDFIVSFQNGRKNVGKYSVTITMKGNYSGKKTVYFYINPKTTSLKLLSAGRKKLTVKWGKQTTATTGYEIQYSTSSNFGKGTKTVVVGKNKVTSKTLSKLKSNKKYYVRIRTYKTVGKRKFYSSWSTKKSAKVK